MIDVLRAIAEVARENGFATRATALPSPQLSLADSPSNAELTDDFIFSQIITEDEIVNVSRDLFESGFYNNSVQESFTALDNFVKVKSGAEGSGTALMRKAFKKSNPLLRLNDGATGSQKDEQEGYEHMFAGSMLGIRNPASHEFQWIDNRETALECLIFCQHLLRRAKLAQPKE